MHASINRSTSTDTYKHTHTQTSHTCVKPAFRLSHSRLRAERLERDVVFMVLPHQRLQACSVNLHRIPLGVSMQWQLPVPALPVPALPVPVGGGLLSTLSCLLLCAPPCQECVFGGSPHGFCFGGESFLALSMPTQLPSAHQRRNRRPRPRSTSQRRNPRHNEEGLVGQSPQSAAERGC